MKIKTKFLLLIWNICIGFFLMGQQYNFIKYSVAEGLPQSQVYDMCEDSRGYIWFGTQGGGLSRFDGLNFENFTTRDSLPSNYIEAVHEDPEGYLWIGTRQGIAFYDGNRFQILRNRSIELKKVNSFHQFSDSILWVGTTEGIFSLQTRQQKLNRLTLHPILDKAQIKRFFLTEEGLWIATNRGAWLYKKGSIKNFTTKDGLFTNEVLSFIKDADGLVWVACFGGGINLIDEKSQEIVYGIDLPNIRRALYLYRTNNNDIWVGTQDRGISIYQSSDSTWINIREQNGLPNNHIREIQQDHWGNTWITSSGGGVAKYLGQFFVHFNRSNGLNGNRIYALCEDQQDRLWMGVANKGVTIYDSLGFHPIDSVLTNVKCKAIFEDTQQRIWIGSEGKGLALYDTSGLRLFTQADGLPSNWIRSIQEDEQGNIWIATYSDGVAKLRLEDSLGLKVQRISRSYWPGDPYISILKKGPKGKLWFATRNGTLGYISRNKIQRIYNTPNGLPNVSIRTIEFDSVANIWIGTAGKGILVAPLANDTLRFSSLQSSKLLTSDNVYLLSFDQEGNLWAGSENGVDKIFLNEAGIATDIQHFGRNEGFLGIETCENAVLTDSENNLWFGTMNGLTKHIPSERNFVEKPPIIHFDQIALFNKALPPASYANLNFPHHQNQLSFAFKAIHLNKPKQVKYRWKLEGGDTDWTTFSNSTSVNYPKLPPGTYTFMVQAGTDTLNISAPISASFSIRKPFWQMEWFIWLVGILGLLLVIIFFKWRERNIKQKEKRKLEKLEIKNRILQLEQKALQLQMNPHFIFNALNSIQSLVSEKSFQNARREINNFATLMRSILYNSRQSKISLREEIKTLEKYLQMEQFCQSVPFQYTIHPPEDIDLDELEIPPMLLQPFVENAVIHGLSHLQNRAGKIEIVFKLAGEILHCRIMDNGVGRMRAAQINQSQKPGHQSTAMQVIKERLDNLLPNQTKEAIQIADLVDQEGKVVGTKVEVKIPVELSF